MNNRKPNLDPEQASSRYARDKLPQTVFGRHWLSCFADEAHIYRNFGKAHTATRALRLHCHTFCAMTATPVTTRVLVSGCWLLILHDVLNRPILKDLANLGRLLGIPYFLSPDGEAEIADQNKDLAAAIRKSRKQRREQGDEAFRKTLHGREVDEVDDPAYIKTREWITEIRSHFNGYVIRRTGLSVDHRGNCISALERYQEHIILLNLYRGESDNLQKISEKLCESKDAGMAFGLGKVSLHNLVPTPSLVDRRASSPPAHPADWFQAMI